MQNFIISQTVFYLTLFFALFLPGYFLILATRMHKEFSLLEIFVLSIGSSIAIVNFLLILLGVSPLHISGTTVFGAISFFILACYACYIRKNRDKISPFPKLVTDNLSKRSTLLVTILLFLTVFINTVHFSETIFPTATDLGHHMYWAKTITVTGKLPVYQKIDVGADFTIQKPAPIADFIIGEHLFFAAIQLLSKQDFVSAFPVLVLYFIHIISILAIFVLARCIFKNSIHRDLIATTALLLIGPLYAIASPQAKFISGGVIGNDVGNLLVPLLILLFLKAFQEKKSQILAFALFLSLGLAYVHHLSTFVFIFLAIFTIAAYAVLTLLSDKQRSFHNLFQDVKSWLQMALKPEVLLVLVMGAIFVFVLYTPTYLNTKAINTAVGAPSKASRAGLTLTQLKSTAGEARAAFAIIGVILLVLASSLGKYRQAFLIGWIGALTLMSLRPDWLFVDIPSNRIASYIVFPVAIIAAYMLVGIFSVFKSENRGKNYLHPIFLLVTFFLLMIFVASNGLYDNNQAISDGTSANKAQQTYLASAYLAAHSNASDMTLKDHNYLAGDTWVKLFFMQDYNYPLSRGYFKRYQDETKNREQCTNFMISAPTSSEAQQCFAGTKTDFVMLNPQMDSAQFHRSNQFWQVYSSDEVAVFYKAQ